MIVFDMLAVGVFGISTTFAGMYRRERDEARRKAEGLLVTLRDRRADIECLHRDIGHLHIEKRSALCDAHVAIEQRDVAIRALNAIRQQRSLTTARGNRTRSLRRRGALLPATDFDIIAGQTADQRNDQKG